jgi:hypothetical protein
MKANQYGRIERLLADCESITEEHGIKTPQGKEIQQMIRQVLAKVAQERIRAETRETKPRGSQNSNEDPTPPGTGS